MPSSYTDELAIEKQAAGENLNTWGDPKLNNALVRLSKGVAGFITVALTTDTTLSSSNSSTTAADYQAYHQSLKFTGTGAFTITVPSKAKTYIIWNACTGTITVTTGSGNTASVIAGEICQVVCDATNVKKVKLTDFGSSRLTSVADPTSAQDAATKAYVDLQAWEAAGGNLPGQGGSAGKFLRTDGTTPDWRTPDVTEISGAAPTAAPSFTGGATVAGGLTISSGGATYTGSVKANVQALAALDCDLSAADFFTKSISTGSAITFSNPTASKAQAFILELTISSAAVPTWPASVKWGGGVDPSSALGNGRHVIGFVTFNGGTTWTGMLGAVAAA